MVLFVSDLHFDHRPPPADPLISSGARAELDLLDCLEAHRPKLSHVVLLGDVFDAWIEYRDLIPKGLTRLLGMLARWSDRGVSVTVVVGNHDPWHRDYMERELGFRLLRSSVVEEMQGLRVAFGHGDQEEYGALSRWQRFIRSRWVHALYAEGLPGSFGQWLARNWSRGARSSRLDMETVDALRNHARGVLGAGHADVVVYGHCHHPLREDYPGGVYLNTGSWALDRTFVTLVDGRATLQKWNGGDDIQAGDAGPLNPDRPFS